MTPTYHILNGDCLKEPFPKSIQGKLIVARECLVDGDVQGTTNKALFETRSRFMSENYKGTSREDYFKKAVTEFDKIIGIPDASEVYLWFEDDLFCQVNLWFVLHLLKKQTNLAIYLVRPTSDIEYGFGGMTTTDLISAFQNKTTINTSEFTKFGKLWRLYQLQDYSRMLNIATLLESKFPFLKPAIKAQIDRISTEGNLGRPKQSLINIMDSLKTKEFGPVFIAFCKQESIYGFGDLQVKRIFDEILDG